MKINVSKIESILKKLKRKDQVLFRATQKKIFQISQLKKEEINYFKNLNAPLSQYKRVHVKSFVLLFRVEGDTIFFDKFEHHDNAYT